MFAFFKWLQLILHLINSLKKLDTYKTKWLRLIYIQMNKYCYI
jgi:hypothetical protein